MTTVGGASFELDMGEIIKRSSGGMRAVNRAIQAAMQYTAPEAENWMKGNAPWEDQTTNARNGLTARYVGAGDSHNLDLFHSVPYGIYLEVRFEGRYAIIGPAIARFGPTVMSRTSGILSGSLA